MDLRGTKRPNAGDSGSNPPAAQSKKAPLYEYASFDAVSVGPVQNVYGFVVDCSCPTRTKGSDMMFLIRIADENKQSLVVRLFESSQEDFPVPICVGDVVRFHRIKFVSINGNIEGGFNLIKKNGSRASMLVIKVKEGGQNRSDWEFLSFPTSNYTWNEDEDTRQVSRLLGSRLTSLSKIVVSDKSFSRRISEIEPKCPFDMICQLHSFEVGAVDLVQTIVVTDGSEPPELYRLPVNVQGPHGAIRVHFTSQHNRIFVTRYLMASSLPIWVRLRNISVVGSSVGFFDNSSMVFMHPCHEDVEGVKNSTSFASMNAEVGEMARPSLRCHALVESRNSTETNNTKEQSSVLKIVQPGNARSMKNPCLDVLHKSQAPTNIMDITTSSIIPNKYKIHGSVRDFFPKSIVDFVRTYCKDCKKSNKIASGVDYSIPVLCSICPAPKILELVYMFQIEIVDKTGALPVLCHGEHAAFFLCNKKPLELIRDPELQKRVEISLQALAHSEELPLCIFSYRHITNPNRTMFQLFDTRLILDERDHTL